MTIRIHLFNNLRWFLSFRMLHFFVLIVIVHELYIKSAFAITCTSTQSTNSLITRQEDTHSLINSISLFKLNLNLPIIVSKFSIFIAISL